MSTLMDLLVEHASFPSDRKDSRVFTDIPNAVAFGWRSWPKIHTASVRIHASGAGKKDPKLREKS
jgi:hypothetical protein